MNNTLLIYLFIALSALLHIVSLPSFEISLLSFFALVPLFWVIYHSRTWRSVFFYSWLTGILTVGISFHWLIHTIHVHGEIPLVFSIVIDFLFVLVFSLKFPAAALLIHYSNRKSTLPIWLTYPILFTTVDFLFPEIFKWYWGALLQGNTVFIQVADIVGVAGLTFVVVFINSIIFRFVLYFTKREKSFPKGALFVAGFVLVFLLTYGLIRMTDIAQREGQVKTIGVGLFQPNTLGKNKGELEQMALDVGVDLYEVDEWLMEIIPVHNQESENYKAYWNWLAENLLSWRITQKHILLAKETHPEMRLAVLPESAFQFAFEGCDVDCSAMSRFLNRTVNRQIKLEIRTLARQLGIYIYVSDIKQCTNPSICPSKSGDMPVLHNNATLISPTGDKNQGDDYQKVYLLAFGEYIPYPISAWKESIGFIKEWTKRVGNYKPGDMKDNIKTLQVDNRGYNNIANTFHFAPLICYEVIMPGFVRLFFEKAQQEYHNVDFIVNTTNDFWFGDSNATYQHWTLASFRAIEHRRVIVRSTITGISGFINADGTLITPSKPSSTKLLSIDEMGYLVDDIACFQQPTFYSQFGDVFSYLCIGITAVLIVFVTIPFLRRYFPYYRV